MDKHMPEMDGLQATQQLRQLGYTGLIIGITGDASAEDAAEYRRYGADDVLCKPITKSILSLALSSRLAREGNSLKSENSAASIAEH
jgi:CheY-like chemotaxis protein